MPRQRVYETLADQAAAGRLRASAHARERSINVRSIRALIPLTPTQLAEKESYRHNLKAFLLRFFPNEFRLEFSSVHEEIVATLQKAILTPGIQLGLMVPRGFGKSTLASCSLLWGLLYHHIQYGVLIAASATAASKLLQNIKFQLLFNPNLAPSVITPESDDAALTTMGLFGEVLFPLRKIGSNSHRAAGLLYNGHAVGATLSGDRIIFPTINGVFHGLLEASGLTGELRGKQYASSAGLIRPDFVLLDDPQTDASARSFSQTAERLDLLKGGISGLASVDRPLSTVLTATIIEPTDLPATLLKDPSWSCVKRGVIDQLPVGEALEQWDKYNALRLSLIAESATPERITAELNEFYLANRELLETGNQPVWVHFKDPGNIDSRQKIMRLFYEKPTQFFREYQNSPELDTSKKNTLVQVDDLQTKVRNIPRGRVPMNAEVITVGCDSQTLGIFWTATAWTPDGTGTVIDFGKFPDGRKQLPDVFKDVDLSGAIRNAYDYLKESLFNRQFQREDGAFLTPSFILLDAGHGGTSDSIKDWIRESNDNRIHPSYGRARASANIFTSKKKPGELKGSGWLLSAARYQVGPRGGRVPMPRHVLFDAGGFKTLLRDKLAASNGALGGLQIAELPTSQLNEFFSHLTSERPTPIQGPFGTLEEWTLIPNRENHWLDSTVLSLVGAAITGFSGQHTGSSLNHAAAQSFTRERRKASDIQRSKRR